MENQIIQELYRLKYTDTLFKKSRLIDVNVVRIIEDINLGG